MRQGFTLVETLVALVLLQFGMLAVLAVSGVAARDLATARHIDQARTRARNRVELLLADACPAAGSFTAAAAPGATEHWRIEAVGRLRVISDTVEYPLPGGKRGRATVRAGMLCRV